MLRKPSIHYVRNFSRISSALSNKENFFTNLGEKTTVTPADWDSAKKYERIPGPKPLPIFGNSWRYLFGELNTKKDLMAVHTRLRDTYGDIVALRKLGSLKDSVILYDPKVIEKMYRNEGVWPSREGFNSLAIYRNVIRKDVYGSTKGLVITYGEEWHNFRSKVNPILMQQRIVEQYISPLEEVADDFIERIKHLQSKNRAGEMPADFDIEVNTWAFESMGVVALGRRLGCLDEQPNPEAQKMAKYMVEMFKMMYTLDLTPYGKYIINYKLPMWRRFVKYQNFFTDMAVKYIDEAIAAINTTENYEAKPESEKSAFEKLLITDRSIAVVMTLDMLAAGIDTTGKITGAILYFLAKNKEAQSTLRSEILELLPNKDSPITKAVLDEAKYLKAVIQEAMRISPINAVTARTTITPVVLNGYQIPVDINIQFPNLYLSNKEDFHFRSDEFLPERWLRSTTGELSRNNINPFVTLPFGHGPRACIGKRLARIEMEILIVKIVRNFILDWPHKKMKFGQELLYGFQDPLKICLQLVQN